MLAHKPFTKVVIAGRLQYVSVEIVEIHQGQRRVKKKSYARHSPIILDDNVDLAEALALGIGGEHYEASLVKADYAATLLPMSGTGKALDYNASGFDARPRSQTSVTFSDYDAARSLRETMYLAYPPSGYSDQQAQASPMTYGHQADQMPYSASSIYEPRANQEVTQSSLSAVGTRELLHVTSYKPDQGPQGSQVHIYIQTSYDLASNPLNISLMFATRHCTPTLDRLEPTGSYYNYLLAAKAPPHATTGSTSLTVPLRLQTQQAPGYDVGTIEVGSFFYTDSVQSSSHALSNDPSRKRKMSLDSARFSRAPTRRLSNQHLADSSATYATNPYPVDHSRGYSYHSQPSTSVYAPSNTRSPAVIEEHSPSLRSQRVQSGIEKSTYYGSTTPSHLQSGLSSPFTSSTRSQYARSPALSGASSKYRTLGSPNAGYPGFARTPTSHGSSVSTSNALYPYGYKAVLNLHGELNTMTEGWSVEETAAKRRLVQFSRSQNNNTIEASFAAVPIEHVAPKGLCVSCIWWEERQECYVTSVDTIQLLESLVAVKFQVEEKNRIRRNLEGFKPTTVSKAKSDSEDFFSVIMGFPNPKPRNIEKDVKVFPWKILKHALKKIIGKYSASYSSTASAMLSSRSSGYGTHSEYPIRPTASARSDSSSSSSTYTATSMMASSSISPHISNAQTSMAPYSEASVYGPPSAYTYAVPALPAQYMSQTQSYASSAQIPPTSLPPRSSWDLNAYIDTGPDMAGSVVSTAEADGSHSIR